MTASMDQSKAINALAPFIALAKSATSPRAAADLVTQATSAHNTYVFAELLQQPNVQALANSVQYASSLVLLQTFAWGTWESYRTSTALPALSDAQALKLRLLSLLTIAAEKTADLNYASLCARLDLSSAVDLEHLVVQAIYNNLITATLNPAAQTVIVTSVAPLRDLAPGSLKSMVAELAAWSGRCDAVLEQLDGEIKKVKADAEKRAKREVKADKQFKAVTEQGDKAGASRIETVGGILGSRSGHGTRASSKRDQADDDEDFEDAMDVDDSGRAVGGRKKSGGLLGKLTGKGSK